MMQGELERCARILAAWGEALPLKIIYIFGSRVRGDATETSDLDVALEFEPPSQIDKKMSNWNCENETDFAALKGELGIPLSLHADRQDAVWPSIRAAATNPAFSVGIVRCVITPKVK
jgi:predicted nucleotidyltransferase